MGMDQEEDEDTRRRLSSLLAARTSLRAGVERSRALTHALARSGTKMSEIQARLQAASAAVRPIRAPRDALEGAGPNIDRAVGPAAAVLKVFDAVHGLEPPLLLSGAAAQDLPGYLAVVARLEEALRFLADNCGLAAQWLADIVAYLGAGIVDEEAPLRCGGGDGEVGVQDNPGGVARANGASPAYALRMAVQVRTERRWLMHVVGRNESSALPANDDEAGPCHVICSALNNN